MNKRRNGHKNGFIGGMLELPTLSTWNGTITPEKTYYEKLEIEQWTKPDDWLSLPGLTVGDQKFIGLYAIYPGAPGNTGFSADSNHIAIQCAGNYIVDWGDGVTRAYTSNTRADYNYNYGNISNSTLTTEGFKQVIVQAYPQTGSTLTSVRLDVKYTLSGITLLGSGSPMSEWLDIKIAGASLSTLTIGQQFNGSYPGRLKRFEYVGPSSLGRALFQQAYSLDTIVGTEWTAGITNFNSMFLNCYSLRNIPCLDTRKSTNVVSMFQGCRSLFTAPPIDTSNATSTNYMFRDCYALSYVPLYNTSKITNFDGMFFSCYSLETIPPFDTIAGTNFSNFFYQNYNLKDIPLLDSSSVTNFTNMFASCVALKSIPNMNTSVGTNFNGMFSGCGILDVPNLNTSNGTNFSNMFNTAVSLRYVPTLDTSKGNCFAAMYRVNRGLVEIPYMDLSGFSSGSTLATAGLYNTFTSNTPALFSLRKVGITGASRSISVENMTLSATELNRIFQGLANVTGTGATITITNNWGSSLCDTTIATTKGWTVVN